MAEEKSIHLHATLSFSGNGMPEPIRADGADLKWEARYKDLFEAASDVILMLDTDGNVLDTNHRVEEVTGFSRDEIVQRNVIRDLTVPEDRAVIEQALQNLEGDESRSLEVRWLAKDGSVLLLEGRCSACSSVDGEFQSTHCILRDVTDRRRSEEQLCAKEAELAHLARLSDVGVMATGLVHEISDSLCAINNYAHGALKNLQRETKDFDKLSGVLEEISTEANRATDIIHHIRSFVDKRETSRASADINDIVQNVLQIFGAEIRSHGVDLVLSLADDLPRVFVDTVQIQQCLVNLVRNSLNAMDGQPDDTQELTLTTQASHDGKIMVAVSDTGRGIAEGIGDKLFEPFFTTRADGLGMGLAISKTIIESHDGQIEIVSNPERGVTSHFTLSPSPEQAKD